MEKQDRSKGDRQNHRNSLLRIAACCGIPHFLLETMSIWDIEDAILSRLDQGKLEKKRGLAKIKELQKQIDMLKQISIFDFLKIHHDEIKTQETDHFLGDDG